MKKVLWTLLGGLIWLGTLNAFGRMSYQVGYTQASRDKATPFDLVTIRTRSTDSPCKGNWTVENHYAYLEPIPPSQRDIPSDRWLLRWYQCVQVTSAL